MKISITSDDGKNQIEFTVTDSSVDKALPYVKKAMEDIAGGSVHVNNILNINAWPEGFDFPIRGLTITDTSEGGIEDVRFYPIENEDKLRGGE